MHIVENPVNFVRHNSRTAKLASKRAAYSLTQITRFDAHSRFHTHNNNNNKAKSVSVYQQNAALKVGTCTTKYTFSNDSPLQGK